MLGLPALWKLQLRILFSWSIEHLKIDQEIGIVPKIMLICERDRKFMILRLFHGEFIFG